MIKMDDYNKYYGYVFITIMIKNKYENNNKC